ncbi:class I SAM-dependent methyltransferase, partial [Methylophilaceae bacterium]|nr:class I SAM-dependent methyltransferase [Methylophilaceae bacterium]
MAWFETKRGSDLLLLEQKILDQLFDHLFGYNIVQIGNHRTLIENSRFKNKYTCKQIQFNAEQMPFESDSIDCIVLPHQNTEDERILSEVYRSLIPHGHAIFINFNPWSPI